MYKVGAKYSRRGIDEILEDIRRAKLMDDYLYEQGVGFPVYSSAAYSRIPDFADAVKAAQWEAGIFSEQAFEIGSLPRPESLDPRMAWFLSWFNSTPDIEQCMNHIVTWRISGGRTCFLGDADSLTHKPDFIKKVIGEIRLNFPGISRFTVYGRTSTAARIRSLKELKSMAGAGLHRVHFGLESGCDTVLTMVNKGVSAEEQVAGCLKTKEAGLSCSVYVMPGLGGAAHSDANGHDTARVLSRIGPDFIRLRSLEIFPMTALEEARKNGAFIEATEELVVREIRILIEETDADTEILSDSASNLLPIFGKLPRDRKGMLETIDEYLDLDPREKLEFSVRARIESFIGQYGELTEDIISLLAPCIKENKLDFKNSDDTSLKNIISLIRSKLMP